MPNTATTYGNGGVNVTDQGGYNFDPNSMGMGNMQADMEAMMRFKQQQALQAMSLRERQFGLQERGFNADQNQRARANQMEDTDRERMRAEQLRATMQLRQPEGTQMYVKPMTGMNMSGGYGQAQPWEQGAAFAGYAPSGTRPQSSSFSPPNPAQGQVNLGGNNIGRPVQPSGGEEDGLGDVSTRYFKQFGDIPDWLKTRREHA